MPNMSSEDAVPPDGKPLDKDEDDDDESSSETGEEKKGEDEDNPLEQQQMPDPPLETSATIVKASPIPTICLIQGLNRKQSAFKLESWIALSLTLDGRDKITKVFQYAARMLAWWLAGSPQAERFKAVKASLTTSRKAYRLGRTLIEYYKLRSMGLARALGWYLQQTLSSHDEDDDDFFDSPSSPSQAAPRPVLKHRASSNIGWGPSTALEKDLLVQSSSSSPSAPRRLYRSLSGAAYRRMYRPMVSRLSSTMIGDAGSPDEPPASPLWKIVGSAMKMVGLFGFWAGDNTSFLTSSGLFDDFTTSKDERMARRQRIQTKASQTANRFYFFGAIAGLVVNLKSYLEYRVGPLQKAQRELQDADGDDVFDDGERQELWLSLEKAKEKEFALFVALLKSCCDVLVFSNNPGIDLWLKYRGKKLHEGVHCVGGLLSASTVLYNNFPNKKTH